MQQLFEIYKDKQTHFCVGCLHTEDVTQLSRLNNYAPIFSIIFTNLYTTEELEDLWICCWCIQRMKNTQKLCDNLECAKRIMTKINHVSSSSENVSDNLLSEIHDLKTKSRPNFKAVLDKNDFIYTVSPSKYKTDITDKDFDEKFAEEFNFKLNFSPEEDIYSSKYRIVKKNINVFKKQKNKIKDLFKHKKETFRKCDSQCANNSRKKKTLPLGDEMHNRNVLTDFEKKLTCLDIDKISSDIINLEVEKKIEEHGVKDIFVSEHDKKIGKKCKYLRNETKKKMAECDSEFSGENDIANRIERKHGKKYNQSNRIFGSKINTVQKRHKRRWSECALCGKLHKNRHEIIQHLKKHEKCGSTSKESDKTVCKHCANKYDQSYIEKHPDKQCKLRFNCHYCQKGFKNRAKRLSHIEENHKLVTDIADVFQCSYCERKLNSENDLKNHIKTNHISKHDCPCPVCLIKLKGLRKVHRHMHNIHSKISAVKNKQCLLCDKAFTSTKKLKRHQFVHTGQKYYKCNVCPSANARNYHLKEHKHSKHNGETPTGGFPLAGVVRAPTTVMECPGLPTYVTVSPLPPLGVCTTESNV